MNNHSKNSIHRLMLTQLFIGSRFDMLVTRYYGGDQVGLMMIEPFIGFNIEDIVTQEEY